MAKNSTSRQFKRHVHTNTCISMFIAALFLIAKKKKKGTTQISITWLTDKQNVKYLYHMLLVSSEWIIMKNWHMLPHGWNLKTLSRGKEARHKRPHIVWFHLYEMSRISKSIETGSRLIVSRGWGWGIMRTNGLMGGVAFR